MARVRRKKIDERIADLREQRIAAGGKPVPTSYQGVTKDRIRKVLSGVDLGNKVDIVDGVFALLDNETPSFFSRAPNGSTVSSGASTAMLATHIGILQRGAGKIDREGRDMWIKPLRELGGIEAVTLDDGQFVAGHIKANTPNSAYRLEKTFLNILTSPEGEWQKRLADWSKQDAGRERLAFQARMAEASRKASNTGHADLIKSCVEDYAPRFLNGYSVLFVDDSDGDKISDAENTKMTTAGALLTRSDPKPDVLLWHPEKDALWVIEAVTSDGEVDAHKVKGMQAFAKRCGKKEIGFTTAYLTWRAAATRQGKQKNIAVETYIWIKNDPSKHLLVTT